MVTSSKKLIEMLHALISHTNPSRHVFLDECLEALFPFMLLVQLQFSSSLPVSAKMVGLMLLFFRLTETNDCNTPTSIKLYCFLNFHLLQLVASYLLPFLTQISHCSKKKQPCNIPGSNKHIEQDLVSNNKGRSSNCDILIRSFYILPGFKFRNIFRHKVY